jgi:adenylosuccinate synthase
MKNNLIVVLSGEIGAGKSTLAENLTRNFGFKILKTKDALKYYSKKFKKQSHEDDRMFLQRVGEQMDKKTNGKWVVEYFQKSIIENDKTILDSSRIQLQINALRESFGYQKVIHVYLNASEKTLELRHFERNHLDLEDFKAIQEYKAYKSNPTEQRVTELANEADLVIDTDKLSPLDNAIRVASFLRLLPETHNELVDIIIGAQFGSEGKGQISAYLSPEYDCLVRVGGPNAGHKVYAYPNPVTFHLLPSGVTRAPKAKIIIGPGAVISLKVILDEINKFNIQPDRLIIDELATIISKDDIKLEEKLDKIGSTKQGVGAATANNLFLHRLMEDKKHKAKYCPQLKQYISSAHMAYENLYASNKKILLEGTQGTMLSLHHGIYPYVTSRDTSVSGCISEAGISPRRVRKIIMVTRTYPIRVKNPEGGTSGPFSRGGEDIELTLKIISERSKIPVEDLAKTEISSTTEKPRRIAEFNWGIFRESCELNSPTDIALTFTDYIDVKNRTARRYDQLTKATTKFIDEVERCSGVQVSLIATHFNHRAIIDRRNWI